MGSPEKEEERREGMEGLQVSLGVNNELIKTLEERVGTIADSQARELGQLKEQIGTIVRDDELHDLDHDWIRLQREAAQDNRDFWRGALKNVTAAGIWGTILLVLGVMWYAFKQFISHSGPHGG